MTSSHASRAASPIAYNVCCTERLMCEANVSTSARRMRSRAAKSALPARYLQFAVIEVARIRSSVSGSVVNLSRGKPLNAESVVLSTTRFVKPDLTVLPRSEEHTSELQSQSNLVCRLLLEKKKKKN